MKKAQRVQTGRSKTRKTFVDGQTLCVCETWVAQIWFDFKAWEKQCYGISKFLTTARRSLETCSIFQIAVDIRPAPRDQEQPTKNINNLAHAQGNHSVAYATDKKYSGMIAIHWRCEPTWCYEGLRPRLPCCATRRPLSVGLVRGGDGPPARLAS